MNGSPERTENAKPLLTIAIPTYNRAGCLRELLTLLIEQVKHEPRLELIISDNASPDNTSSVVQEFLDRALPVRYIRNLENIGADANFLQCFKEAKGKYVWIFSDDDLIIPGALRKILHYCEAAEYDLIWVNSYSFGQSHLPCAATAQNDALEIFDPRTYAKHVHIFFTFISGNIINKDRVFQSQDSTDFAHLVGTNFGQLAWTYTALNGFVRGLYIREKLIAVRADNTGGYKLFQVFGPGLANITNQWVKSAKVRRVIMNGTIQRFWPVMLLRYKKVAKDFTQEAKPENVLNPLFGDNFRYWLFAYPIIVLPYPLAALWTLAVRVVNRLDKAAGYPLL